MAVDPVVRTLGRRTAADKEEQDDWKPVGKAGKSCAVVVKRREKQLPMEGHGCRSG